MAQYPTPVYPNWGQSLGGAVNQGFEGIMQGMQQAQQQKMQSLAFQQQTGFDPQQLMQGRKIGQQIQQPSPMPAGYQGPQTATVGGQPETQKQRDLFDEYQQFASQSKAGAQAKVADIQSQADLRQAQAGFYQRRPGGGANSAELTPERQAAGEWAMNKGLLAPSELRSRGAATNFLLDGIIHSPEYQADIIASGGKIGPQSFNPISAEAAMTGTKSQSQAAGAVRGGQGTEVAAAGGSLEDVFNQMAPLINKLSPTSIAAVNSALQKGESRIAGDPEASALLTLVPSARSLYAKVLAGKGVSDVEAEQSARQAIPDGISKEAFPGIRYASLADAYSRAGRLQGTIKTDLQPPAGYVQPEAPASKQDKSAPKNSGKSGARQVTLMGQDGKPRVANYNGKKFAGWADGGQ